MHPPRLSPWILLAGLLLVPALFGHSAQPEPDKDRTERKVRQLLASLEAREDAKRASAARDLGALGPAARAAVPALTAALKDKSAQVRLESAFALLKIDQSKGKEALATITALLEDRTQADWSVFVVLYMKDIRPASKETVAGILALARHRHPLASVASGIALDNLGKQAREAAGLLEEALKDPLVGIRTRAALGLARIDPKYNPQALAVLQAALKEQDFDVRKQAAEALIEIDRQQIPLILTALAPGLKDPKVGVRLQTASFLLQLDPTQAKEALPVLTELLKDKDSKLRLVVVNLLADLGSRIAAAEDDLRALFKDSDSDVAAAAVEAVMRLHPDKARDLFATLVEKRDPKKQRNTAEILKLIAELHKLEEAQEGQVLLKSLTEQLRKPFNRAHPHLIRLDAVLRLAALGPRAKDAVPDLLKALDDSSLVVRSQALYALGQVGPDAAAATAHLVELYKDVKDTPADLRDQAAQALRKISPKAAREAGIR